MLSQRQSWLLILSACVGILLTAGAFYVDGTGNMTRERVSFDTEAQETVPANATVYGQGNLSGKEYKYFTEYVLGETITDYRYNVPEDASPQWREFADENSGASEFYHGEVNSGYATANEEQEQENRYKTIFYKSLTADYVQADGYYYPVEQEFGVRPTIFPIPIWAMFKSIGIGSVVGGVIFVAGGTIYKLGKKAVASS